MEYIVFGLHVFFFCFVFYYVRMDIPKTSLNPKYSFKNNIKILAHKKNVAENDAAYFNNCKPTFRRYLLPPSSPFCPDYWRRDFPQKFRYLSANYAISCRTRSKHVDSGVWEFQTLNFVTENQNYKFSRFIYLLIFTMFSASLTISFRN
jgi:hypothetical protein